MFTGARLVTAVLALGSTAWGAEFNAADAVNQTGLDVFRRLDTGAARGNLVISPFSIETGLALAYAGADGVTREEMGRAIHLPDNDEIIASQFRSLRDGLQRAAERSHDAAERRQSLGGSQDVIRWSIANRLYGQADYAFRPAFIALLRDRYDAPFTPMDFIHGRGAAAHEINAWVAEQTRNRIRNLIPADGITADTRLVLVNALYLKAPWRSPFEKSDTEHRPFYFGDGTRHEVTTMYRVGWLGYAKAPDATIVTLPYAGGELQCVIVLPDQGLTPERLIEEITPSDFQRWSQLGERDHGKDVALHLPKFRLSGQTLRIGAVLRAMGMRSAFGDPPGSANFDRIAPRKPGDVLALSDVFHQTFVAVDEEGTEAAAASAITALTLGVEIKPKQPIEVHVDRPFLFAILHRPTGACLFFGRIGDPR